MEDACIVKQIFRRFSVQIVGTNYTETSREQPGSCHKSLNGLEKDFANSCKIGPSF